MIAPGTIIRTVHTVKHSGVCAEFVYLWTVREADDDLVVVDPEPGNAPGLRGEGTRPQVIITHVLRACLSGGTVKIISTPEERRNAHHARPPVQPRD